MSEVVYMPVLVHVQIWERDSFSGGIVVQCNGQWHSAFWEDFAGLDATSRGVARLSIVIGDFYLLQEALKQWTGPKRFSLPLTWDGPKRFARHNL